MKKFIVGVLALVLTFGILMPAALHANEISVTIDGVAVDFDGQGPANVGGRVLVPVRGVFEALGFIVGWDQPSQMAMLWRYGYIDHEGEAIRVPTIEIGITIGENTFINNGEEFDLDVPAQIIEGRTMLPIRAVVESVGYNVDWDGATNTVVISTASQAAVAPTPPATQATGGSEFELRTFELANLERTNRGIPPLIWCDVLADASRAHSVDMAVNNIASHIGSDGSCVGVRLARAGIEHMGWNENLNFNSRTPEAAIATWMSSPGHRANILDPTATHMGVGMYYLPGSQWTVYTTMKLIVAP